MKNKILPILITLIFIIIFIFFYKGLKIQIFILLKQKLIIKFHHLVVNYFLKKNMINSSDLFKLDQFYLLNIWSSWCVPL